MNETPLSAALTHLRSGDTAISTFGTDPDPFRWHKFGTTKADIFDVRDGQSTLYPNLDDTGLFEHLRDDVETNKGKRRTRVMYIALLPGLCQKCHG